MKALILLPTGMADVPVEALGGRTPLQVAAVPHLDSLARGGRLGLVRQVPAGLPIASEHAVLSVLGYDPRREQASRAGLEAAALGVELQPGDLAFRLNFVSTFRGHLVDLGAGRIGGVQARLLVEALQAELGDERVAFHPGLGYRSLLVIRGGRELDVHTLPPQAVQGHPIREHLPWGRDAAFLRGLMERAAEVLAAHDVNRVRLDLGENPADRVWPWGEGGRALVEPFELRTGRTLAVIAAAPLVRGLGGVVGASVPEVPGATGSWDTDYGAKLRAALARLEDHDVVLLHVAAANEACHEADLRLKIHVLEDLDQRLVGPLLRALQGRDDVRLLVTTDHTTSAVPTEGTSSHVPFALWGPGMTGARSLSYTEADAAAGDLCVEDGHELFELLLRDGQPVRAGAAEAAG